MGSGSAHRLRALGDDYYTEEYGGRVCGTCAKQDTGTNMDTGRAIDMVNGEEAYDDDFVQDHL
jgi:hypothetical protein